MAPNRVNFGTVRLLSPKTIKRKADRDNRIPWWRLAAKKWCNQNGYDKAYRKSLRNELYELEDDFVVLSTAGLADAKDTMYKWWGVQQNTIMHLRA